MSAWLRRVGRWILKSDLALFIGALALYVKTLSPSVYTFDSAELAAGAYSLGIVHPTGYPLYLMLAKLFTLVVPFGDIAYRANLFSAVCAALALVALRRVILLAIGERDHSTALAAAVLFGVSYPFWSEAVVAEVYTLHIFFIACVLWAALRWRETGAHRFFVLLALVFGLSLGNHMSTVLLTPGLAYFVWDAIRAGRRVPLSVWALAAAAILPGLLTYLYLPIRYAAQPALNYAAILGLDLRTWQGLFAMARGEIFAEAMFGYTLPEIPFEFFRFADLLWQTFFGIGLIVAAVGVAKQWRRRRSDTIFLALLAGANALFYVNYRIFDKDTMFLPVFMIVCIWLAWGLRGLRELLAARAAPQSVAWGAAIVFVLMLVVNYQRVDLSGNRITREYAEAVLRQAPRGAFIIGGWIDITPLEYLQVVEGARPDVTLFDWGLYNLGRRAQLRALGLDEKIIRLTTEEEISRIVKDELAGGRGVYSLDSNPMLRKYFSLARESRLLRVGKYRPYEPPRRR